MARGWKLGLPTMYCQQGGALLCPTWVTYSITHPGQHNPYRTSTPSADRSLPIEETATQEKIMGSEEIVTLEANIAAGAAQVSFDWEPLPKEIKIP